MLTGLSSGLTLAGASTGRGGGTGMFTGGEGAGSRAFCGDGILISEGGEGETSWAVTSSVFGRVTSGGERSTDGGGGILWGGVRMLLHEGRLVSGSAGRLSTDLLIVWPDRGGCDCGGGLVS